MLFFIYFFNCMQFPNRKLLNKNTNKIEKHKYTLEHIYFYLTEGCNLACRHCWIAPKFQTVTQSHQSLSVMRL